MSRIAWIARLLNGSSGAGLQSAKLALEDLAFWMGKRDPRTKKGKIFRGSFGLSRPKKKAINPYALPPEREGVRIPQQLRPHPLLPPAAAATLA